MTDEQARKILIEYTDMDKDVDSEYLQAIKVAISALENNDNSAEINDNDLISKQDILFSLSYYEIEDVVDEQDFGYNHAIQTIRDDVMTMKTYSVKEDTAEWIIENNGGTTMWYECSKCGVAGDIWDKFCKHCGRKMTNAEEK